MGGQREPGDAPTNLASSRNMSTRRIDREILHVFDQILQGPALRPVIRIFLEIAKPPVAFLRVDILHRVHGAPLRTSRPGTLAIEAYRDGGSEGQL